MFNKQTERNIFPWNFPWGLAPPPPPPLPSSSLYYYDFITYTKLETVVQLTIITVFRWLKTSTKYEGVVKLTKFTLHGSGPRLFWSCFLLANHCLPSASGCMPLEVPTNELSSHKFQPKQCENNFGHFAVLLHMILT